MANTILQVVPRSAATRLRPDASYLVVGGFGGIGRSICHWLAEHGARNLVVVSRTAGNVDKITSLRKELDTTARGVNITAIGCDISNMKELKTALDEHARARLPPIKGIIHGGMALKVSYVTSCDW